MMTQPELSPHNVTNLSFSGLQACLSRSGASRAYAVCKACLGIERVRHFAADQGRVTERPRAAMGGQQAPRARAGAADPRAPAPNQDQDINILEMLNCTVVLQLDRLSGSHVTVCMVGG